MTRTLDRRGEYRGWSRKQIQEVHLHHTRPVKAARLRGARGGLDRANRIERRLSGLSTNPCNVDQAAGNGPRYPDPYAHLAWLWATYPDPSLRDGKKAVEFA